MQRAYYDSGSLARALLLLEEQYGLSSEEFYEAYMKDGESISHVSGFDQHLWASFYRELCEADGGEFVADVEQALELA